MYFNKSKHMYEFLCEFLSLEDYFKVLPDFHGKVLKATLDVLFENAVDYLKENKARIDESELFTIIIFFEAFSNILEDRPVDNETKIELSFLVSESSTLVYHDYLHLIEDTPSYFNALNSLLKNLDLEVSPFC